jgi:hypothetical protein
LTSGAPIVGFWSPGGEDDDGALAHAQAADGGANFGVEVRHIPVGRWSRPVVSFESQASSSSSVGLGGIEHRPVEEGPVILDSRPGR